MVTNLFARLALLPDGWRENVRIEVASGRIVSVAEDCRQASGDFLARIVIPGLCNAHSHAFQRALAGPHGAAQPRTNYQDTHN